MSVSQRPVMQWKVTDLHESPHQRALFDDLPDHELAELVEDLRVHGQRTPLEILDNGQIVDGHQRKLAAEVLGWETLAVVVRDDLTDANSNDIECAMIDANLHRRQLDVLAIARLYARMRQIARGWDSDEFFGAVKRDVRDLLAERLGGVSGRTLDRYVKLLETPREVQDAVRRQELPMGMALKVAKLSEDDKARIAAAIRGGQTAREVISAFFEARRARPTSRATQEFLAVLANTVPASPETTTTNGSEDLGALQQPVEELDSVVSELLQAHLPDEQKVFALVEAKACIESAIDSPEMERAG